MFDIVFTGILFIYKNKIMEMFLIYNKKYVIDDNEL